MLLATQKDLGRQTKTWYRIMCETGRRHLKKIKKKEKRIRCNDALVRELVTSRHNNVTS